MSLSSYGDESRPPHVEMNQGLLLRRRSLRGYQGSACSCDYLPIFHLTVILSGWLDWPIGQTILRVRCAWERRIGGCPRGFVTNRVLPGCYLLFTLVCLISPLLCSSFFACSSCSSFPPHKSVKIGTNHIIWYQSSRLTRIWFVFPPKSTKFFFVFEKFENFHQK